MRLQLPASRNAQAIGWLPNSSIAVVSVEIANNAKLAKLVMLRSKDAKKSCTSDAKLSLPSLELLPVSLLRHPANGTWAAKRRSCNVATRCRCKIRPANPTPWMVQNQMPTTGPSNMTEKELATRIAVQ